MLPYLDPGTLALISALVPGVCSSADGISSITGLRPFLSREASITYNRSTAQRWSDFNAPTPGALINVATENDVAATVRFCNKNNITFLAQNGGSGWSSSLRLGPDGVIINLHGLNQVTFNSARTQATIGGGTIISEAIEAAFNSNAQLTTGNCNCVGVLGAILGGGYGNLMGLTSFGIDRLLSVNYVNANGNLATVTPNQTDIWWALRGAGPNFGIVTSAVVKSTYVAQAESTAWLGSLIFTQDKLESVVSAINNIYIEPEMNVFLYFVISESKPAILVTPFYYGNDTATARKKFASILNIGPAEDTTAVTPYNHWNDGAETFCIRGGRKPTYGAGMQQLIPSAWRAVWNEFVNFTSNPGTEQTIILMEAYSLTNRAVSLDSTASFPYRQVPFNAAAIAWYANASLDLVAEAFGNKVRDLWWNNDDIVGNVSYINFAHGDETLDIVYGSSLQRLQTLKQRYDPANVFNHWFPLTPNQQPASS